MGIVWGASGIRIRSSSGARSTLFPASVAPLPKSLRPSYLPGRSTLELTDLTNQGSVWCCYCCCYHWMNSRMYPEKLCCQNCSLCFQEIPRRRSLNQRRISRNMKTRSDASLAVLGP